MQHSNRERALVVFSGGQDSTTCLLHALKRYKEVVAVSFNYGQRHSLELECASAICKELGVVHHILDMGLLNQLAPNALTRSDILVDESATPGHVPNTFVPGRNHLFISFAAVLGKQLGIYDIITGVSEADYSGYPDCRDQFIKSLNVSLNLAMACDFNILTPLMWRDKEGVWAWADEIGALDFIRDKTLTCYNGIIGHGCMACPACDLRHKGLMAHLEKQNPVNI